MYDDRGLRSIGVVIGVSESELRTEAGERPDPDFRTTTTTSPSVHRKYIRFWTKRYNKVEIFISDVCHLHTYLLCLDTLEHSEHPLDHSSILTSLYLQE